MILLSTSLETQNQYRKHTVYTAIEENEKGYYINNHLIIGNVTCISLKMHISNIKYLERLVNNENRNLEEWR
jgi:hypothetical protein